VCYEDQPTNEWRSVFGYSQGRLRLPGVPCFAEDFRDPGVFFLEGEEGPSSLKEEEGEECQLQGQGCTVFFSVLSVFFRFFFFSVERYE